jgi:site-specific recombinase XerD
MLKEYLDRFLVSREANGAAARTVTWYRNNLQIYLSWLELNPSQRFDDVETLEHFLVAQRNLGLKPSTIHARYRSLSAWFTWLHKRDLIPASPIARLDAPRLDVEPVAYVRRAEYDRLWRSFADTTWIDKRDHVILYLLYWCGLRVSELVALALGDIDLAAKLVTIRRGKGGKGRVIPCGDDLGPILLSYLMSRPLAQTAESALLLGSDGAGGIRHTLTAAGVSQMLERRCAAAKLRRLSPHKFRHGFAMAFLNAGMDMSAVSKTMGHSTQAVTADRYAKWLTDGLSRQYGEVRARLLAEK